MLCKRHNEALSPLDDMMGKFFARLTDSALEFRRERPPKPRRHVFNGHDIERWWLKPWARWLPFRIPGAGFDSIAWLPPSAWLEVLFHERRLAAPLGLYFTTQANSIIGTRDQVGVRPLFEKGSPVGVRCDLSGFDFVFVADAEFFGGFRVPGDGTYRLGNVRIGYEGIEKIVAMRWRPGQAVPTNLVVTWYPPAPGEGSG